MYKNRIESIEFRAFMNGEYNRKEKHENRLERKIKAIDMVERLQWIPLVGLGVYLTNKLYPSIAAGSPNAIPVSSVHVGAVPAGVKEQIIHAFDPLVDLITSLALPISSVMIAGGSLLVMIGQKEKGYTLIMNSAIGYVLVQLTPLFISLLAGVGGAI